MKVPIILEVDDSIIKALEKVRKAGYTGTNWWYPEIVKYIEKLYDELEKGETQQQVKNR